ncbi:MAG: hypothetical protein IKL10_03835 [Clostridia bacterium]|nr:hypothetical protein [Clostridia bacterium]
MIDFIQAIINFFVDIFSAISDFIYGGFNPGDIIGGNNNGNSEDEAQ